MKIMISACLLGKNCKYNGKNNLNEKVLSYADGHKIIPVCPESLAKLPIPRPPAEIVNGIVTNKEGLNIDEQFRAGSQKAFDIAVNENIDMAILKANSPSCGCGRIYDGTFTGTLIDGNGTFAELLIKQGIKVISEKDL